MTLKAGSDKREALDLAMKLVQKHCGKYMNVYANCVDKYPDTWHLDCEVPRVKLAACASENPLVVEIKNKCAHIHEDYEKCLLKNPIHVQPCTELLHNFNDCAKDVTLKVSNSNSS